MKFSLRLPNKLAARLDRAAKQTSKSRNALITEALAQRLAERLPDEWPRAVREFRGTRGAPRFEKYREDLAPDGSI
jgi:predicted transcriptional regulator